MNHRNYLVLGSALTGAKVPGLWFRVWLCGWLLVTFTLFLLKVWIKTSLFLFQVVFWEHKRWFLLSVLMISLIKTPGEEKWSSDSCWTHVAPRGSKRLWNKCLGLIVVIEGRTGRFVSELKGTGKRQRSITDRVYTTGCNKRQEQEERDKHSCWAAEEHSDRINLQTGSMLKQDQC